MPKSYSQLCRENLKQVKDSGYELDCHGKIKDAGDRLWSMKTKAVNPYSYKNRYYQVGNKQGA